MLGIALLRIAQNPTQISQVFIQSGATAFTPEFFFRLSGRPTIL